MSRNPNELSKLWKNAVNWSENDRPHTYNGAHTDTYVALYYDETSCYGEADAFASDITSSVPFVDPEGVDRDINFMDVFDQLHMLWEVAKLPFNEFLALLKLTPLQCANRFCIPYGTMDDWMDGTVDAPPYVRLMMAEAIGILDIRSRYATD